jgi:hypothetical protein
MLVAGFRTNKERLTYIFDLKLADAAHFGDMNSKEATRHNRKAERIEIIR